MNLLGIYNRIVGNVYGDTAPPASIPQRLKGRDGIISMVMRKTQEERNYWFMKREYQIPIVAGTKTYAFPADVKELIAARYVLEDGGIVQALSLRTGERYRMPDKEADYPRLYDIEGGALILASSPLQDSVLFVNCWAYLPKPPDNTDAWDAHSDALTEFGSDVIINSASVEMAKLVHDFPMANFYLSETKRELDKLGRHNFSKIKPAPFGIEYNDF